MVIGWKIDVDTQGIHSSIRELTHKEPAKYVRESLLRRRKHDRVVFALYTHAFIGCDLSRQQWSDAHCHTDTAILSPLWLRLRACTVARTAALSIASVIRWVASAVSTQIALLRLSEWVCDCFWSHHHRCVDCCRSGDWSCSGKRRWEGGRQWGRCPQMEMLRGWRQQREPCFLHPSTKRRLLLALTGPACI